MKFKESIPKYKQKLLSLLLTLAIAVTTFMQYPITAYATELDTSTAVSLIVNSTSFSGTGNTNHISNGVLPNRTGYLCYLLTKDGDAVPGTIAYAFESPKSAYIGGSQWICSSRRGGYTASSWNGGEAPWGLTPWEGDGSPSNEPKIKEYFETIDGDGIQNGVRFVDFYWGQECMDKFIADEYIIVIETIMNFQYSTSNGNATTPDVAYASAYASAQAIVNAKFPTHGLFISYIKKSDPDLYSAYVDNNIKPSELKTTVIKDLAAELLRQDLVDKNGRTFQGPPLIGTVPNLLEYKNSNNTSNPFWSYTNAAACSNEMIVYSEAGFTACDIPFSKSNPLTDAQVQQYGVAMMIIHAKSDGIPTWDSITYPTGDPGPAPTEPKGKYNIVKNYYTKDGETGEFISDDGCFIREGVVPTIHVINEPQYQVVGYKTSTTTQSIPSNLWDSWSPPNPQKQKKSTGTVKLESPETCIYVLLERIENPEPEVIDYNYILKESQITRRVYFSFPDEDTAKYKDSPQSNMNSPYIYEHEFRWISPKVPICKGHPYMDNCPWHDPGCNENCLEDCDIDHSFQHDYDCVEATAYCKDPDWEEKSLLLSINNTLQEDYKNVLVPQATWNREVELEKETKHYYKDDQPFDRQVLEDIEWHPKSGGYPNWDYICVLMRGADKLTLAEWENHGEGNQNKTEADSLVNVSEAGFTMANQDSGTRKTLDYYEKFNAKFDNELTPGGVYFFAHF